MKPRNKIAVEHEHKIIPEEPDPFDDHMEDVIGDSDPEQEIITLRTKLRHKADDLIDPLIQKFYNAKAEDALKIWESFADRGELTKPQPQNSTGNINVLNLGTEQVLPMLQGLTKMLKGAVVDEDPQKLK